MRNLFLSVFAFSFLFLGCSKSSNTPSTPPAPTASFTWQSSNLTAPSTVVFTNTSTNATSYSWAFGDGGTSTSQNPTHLFTTAGTYTVTLTSTGSGSNATTSQVITVTSNVPAPTASFTWTKTSTTAPSTVTFTSTVTNATSYLWNFGDGNTDNTANPVHTYTTGNTYTVSLTVTGAGGSFTYTKGITILVPTTLQISVTNGSSIATGVSVKLFNTNNDLNAYFSSGTDNSVVTGTTNSNGVASFSNFSAGTKYFWLATNGCKSSWWNSLDSIVIVANKTNTGSASLDQLETLTIKNTNYLNSAQITINGTLNFGYLTTISAAQSYSIRLPLGTYNITSYDPTNGKTQYFSINLTTCGGSYTQSTNP